MKMKMKKQAFTLIMDKEEEKFIALTMSKDFDISWQDNNGNSLLTQSIRYGLTKIFDRLLELNIDIDAVNGYGITPLMWTIKALQVNMFSKIMERNPNLSLKNGEQISVVSLLLQNTDKENIEKFIYVIEDRKCLSFLKDEILQTNHLLKDYTIGIIAIKELNLKLNSSLSDKINKGNRIKI